MATTAAYTPLECLLLFQSLVYYGTQDDVFSQISELMNSTALVTEGPTFDPQRLSAQSLRAQYLQLLHDEFKVEKEGTPEDGSQPGSKKRKLQSPPPPSLADAQQHKDKLPLLVDRLYARYRDYMTRAIREDERKYAEVQRQIDEIERGEWDERILREDQDLVNANKSSAVSVSTEPSQVLAEAGGMTNGTTSRETQPQEPKIPELKPPEAKLADVVKEVTLPPKVSTAEAQSPRIKSGPESLPNSDSLNGQSKIPAPASPQVDLRQQNGAKPIRPAMETQRPESNGSPAQHRQPALQPNPQQAENNWKWEQPYGLPPQAPPYQPGHFPPQFSPPQYPPQGYALPPRGSFSAPQGIPPPHPYVPSSPSPLNSQNIHLPPPNTPGRPRSVSGMDALAHLAGQQDRAGPPSPMMQQGPLPPGAYPPQYQPHHSPVNGQAQYLPYPPQYPGPPQHPGPPQQFQQFAPPPSPRAPFPRPDLIAPENRQYNSPYNANQAPRGPKLLSNQAPRGGPSLPNTPLSRGIHHALITGSGTRWTPNATPTTPRPNSDIRPPPVEPLSPVLTKAKPPPKSTAKKPASKQDSKKVAPEEKSQKHEIKAPASSKAAKPSRRNGQRNRAGSTTSSVIAESHRSQSVMSHADELSMDNDVHHHVKQEVATPVGVEDVGDTTADELSALPRHNSKAEPSPRLTSKRKRDSSVGNAPKSRPVSTPQNQVLWTRQFVKISASALETISGHKSASIFGAPIKERDAPGYKHLILRPQDLKSIRSAIVAGHKAATAAAPDDLNASSSSAWLPISEDLIPPKGIINNAQLEKELMRVFANAIMFNPDPKRGFGGRWQNMGKGRGEGVGFEIDEDGIVKDTKVMSADVEKVIASLRSAERRSEEIREASLAADKADEELDELTGETEENAGNTGSVAKRRRKV
ncbi:hypothetical protein LOCC1_G003426 [Lachnellula occidentalis]|uniref:Bromo domain-containing protein n=1 Tax=Lachnellula occidentalis TaxID=215460 RepID=A0A8H8S5D6_9HELO|nr:hypothetical protein LOCC1_G003426 [Lachnellula occidentalis]